MIFSNEEEHNTDLRKMMVLNSFPICFWFFFSFLFFLYFSNYQLKTYSRKIRIGSRHCIMIDAIKNVKYFIFFLFLEIYLSIAFMWSGSSPRALRSHIRENNSSKPVAYCLQSNSGLSTRAFQTLCRMLRKYSRSFPKRMAICSYS